MTVEKLIEKHWPETLKLWDGYAFRITGPQALEDDAEVLVVLRNKNGIRHSIVLRLDWESQI